MSETFIRESYSMQMIHPFVNGAAHPRVMEVDANILDPGHYVQLWDINTPNFLNGGHHQRWYFLPVGRWGPHAYYIYNLGYKKFLSNLQVVDHEFKMFVTDLITVQNFAWEVHFNTDSSINIVSPSGTGGEGLVFLGLENGSAISYSFPHGNANEKFSLSTTFGFDEPWSGIPVGQTVMFVPQHDQSRCLDLTGGNTANDARIQTWQRMLLNGNQEFALESTTSNIPSTYRIRNVHSGKYLQPFNNGFENGVPIVQEPLAVSNSSQLWNLYGSIDSRDYVHVVNLRSGLALDVSGWGSANGTPVQQWTLHGGENQRFRIAAPSI